MTGALQPRAARAGPLLAALLAAAVSLPALFLPFMSDDWVNLKTAAAGQFLRTPFNYFRPLYIVSYQIDRTLFGLSPAAFHATNLLLAAACAWLAVVAIDKLTGNRTLATLSGILFALHPYHVHTAAWIAGRSDLLYSFFYLLALLAYHRWRAGCRGLPAAALGLFAAALLSKEAAATLPAVLTFIVLLDRRGRPIRDEVVKGLVPMWIVAVVFAAIVRPLALGGPGLAQMGNFGTRWIWKALGYGVAGILPFDTEALELHPLPWAAAAILAAGALLALPRNDSPRLPPLVWAAGAVMLITVAPSLIGLQERFFYLPSAAVAAGCAALLLTKRRRWMSSALAALVCIWGVAGAIAWMSWFEAARAGTSFIAGLEEASRRPGVQTVLIANSPQRVAGPPVVGDFAAAMEILHGRQLEVIGVAEVDYPTSTEDFLDASAVSAIVLPPPRAEVRLRVRPGLHARLNPPRRTRDGSPVYAGMATVAQEADGSVLVTVQPDAEGRRGAYAWVSGRLRQLF